MVASWLAAPGSSFSAQVTASSPRVAAEREGVCRLGGRLAVWLRGGTGKAWLESRCCCFAALVGVKLDRSPRTEEQRGPALRPRAARARVAPRLVGSMQAAPVARLD